MRKAAAQDSTSKTFAGRVRPANSITNGYYVTAPHSEGTKLNIDDQKITGQGDILGGYAYRIAGEKPWSTPVDPLYLIGKGKIKHAYPDSAATATSLTTGRKTYNAAINVDPYGRPLMTIAHELQEKKFSVGVVTSVPISHATPACAYAHNVSRDDYQDLSRTCSGLPSVMHPQSPLPGVDVLIGKVLAKPKKRMATKARTSSPVIATSPTPTSKPATCKMAANTTSRSAPPAKPAPTCSPAAQSRNRFQTTFLRLLRRPQRPLAFPNRRRRLRSGTRHERQRHARQTRDLQARRHH